MLGYERFETGCTARHFCDIWAYVREQCLWVLVYYKFMPLNHSKISLFVCSNKPTCEVPSRRYIYILLVMPLVNLPRTTQENVGPRNVSSDVNIYIYIYIYVSLQLSVQMRYPLNLVLESWGYLWSYITFWVIIADCD